MHLNRYTQQHLLSVVTELQEFYALARSPFVPSSAIVGVHKAVLHALSVFKVDDGIRHYIATMQVQNGTSKSTLEEDIRQRIAAINSEQLREGYPADWALRGLLVILRDAQLSPYKPERSIGQKIIDRLRGVPNQYQLHQHEEALLEPVGCNLAEIVVAYMQTRRNEAA